MSKNKTKFEVSISKSVTVQIWGDLPHRPFGVFVDIPNWKQEILRNCLRFLHLGLFPHCQTGRLQASLSAFQNPPCGQASPENGCCEIHLRISSFLPCFQGEVCIAGWWVNSEKREGGAGADRCHAGARHRPHHPQLRLLLLYLFLLDWHTRPSLLPI